MVEMENMIIQVNQLTRRCGLVLLLAASLISCAASGNRSGSQDAAADQPLPQTTAAGTVKQEPFPKQQLTDDLMFDILLGEIAGQRGALDTAVPHYLQAAENAQDVKIGRAHV